MAIQLFIKYDDPGSAAIIEALDPPNANEPPAGYLGLYIHTGTGSKFTYSVQIDAAIRQCRDFLLEDLRGSKVNLTNPTIPTVEIQTENRGQDRTDVNAIPWEYVGIRLPKPIAGRSLPITAAIEQLREAAREHLNIAQK